MHTGPARPTRATGRCRLLSVIVASPDQPRLGPPIAFDKRNGTDPTSSDLLPVVHPPTTPTWTPYCIRPTEPTRPDPTRPDLTRRSRRIRPPIAPGVECLGAFNSPFPQAPPMSYSKQGIWRVEIERVDWIMEGGYH